MAKDDKPSEHTTDDGQTFYNASLTGSGTINPDGTYGDPLPDPTVQRGGVKDGRTSPGGVKRPDPNEIVPPAQRAAADTADESSSAKRTTRR